MRIYIYLALVYTHIYAHDSIYLYIILYNNYKFKILYKYIFNIK